MREYTTADYPLILEAYRASKNGPTLACVCQAFAANNLIWPVLNPSDLKPTDYANLVDSEICRADREFNKGTP